MDLQTSAPRISNGQLWFSFFSYYDDVGFQFTATWKITESTRAQAMSEDIFTNRLLLQFRWRKKTTTKRFKFWKSNTTAIKIKIKYLGRIWRKEGREEIGCSDAPRLDISCLQWNANRWCLLLCSGRVQWRLFTRWVPTTSTRELLNAVPAELYPQFFRR